MTKIASTGVSSKPTARPTRIAASAHVPQAATLIRDQTTAYGRQRVGQALERVAQKPAREPAVRPPRTRPPACVRAAAEEGAKHREHQTELTTILSTQPSSVTKGRLTNRNATSARMSKPRSSMTDAGRVRTSTRRATPSAPGESPRRAPEARCSRRRRRRPSRRNAAVRARCPRSAPAGGLEPVDDAHADDRSEERQDVDAAERLPDGAEIGSTNRRTRNRRRPGCRLRLRQRATGAGRSRGRRARAEPQPLAPSTSPGRRSR